MWFIYYVSDKLVLSSYKTASSSSEERWGKELKSWPFFFFPPTTINAAAVLLELFFFFLKSRRCHVFFVLIVVITLIQDFLVQLLEAFMDLNLQHCAVGHWDFLLHRAVVLYYIDTVHGECCCILDKHKHNSALLATV